MRFRITVRGLGLELRGFMDQGLDEDRPTLTDFAKALEPFGLVIASPLPSDGDPFDGQPTLEKAREVLIEIAAEANGTNDLIARLARLHYMQAMVIRGERDEKEATQIELRERELHHFETEEILDAIRAARSNHPECDVHGDDDPITCGWKRAIIDIDKALTNKEAEA